MSTHAKALARSVAGLLGCLVATGAWAQQSEMKVGKIDTKVDVVTLQAGEAYGFDDAALLSEDGKKLLDAVLGSLKDEYVYQVDVSGYTDRIGDEAYNLDLSGRRAQSAADHLTKGGIPAERIKIHAMGSSDPIVDCGDKTGDELIACLAPNRRTEVRFFYPRASLEGMVVVKEQLSTAAGEYTAIYSTSTRSTALGTRAIEVFMEGCRADIEIYCDQVTPGEQRLMACIYAHEDKVSDRCKGNVRDALLMVKADIAQANFVGRLCGPDILAHCGDVEPGDGRIQACLTEKRADLSQTCRQALANLLG